MSFQQYVDLELYAKKASNEIITGGWTFQQPVLIDVSSSSYGLTIDNDGVNTPFLRFKGGSTEYGNFSTILGTPGFFSAPGGSVFFSTSNPGGATGAFTLYTDATGSLSNVANTFYIQGLIGAFNWPVLAQFAYNATHFFTNHLTSGTSWLFNNNAVLASGFLARWQNSSVDVITFDNIGNVVTVGNYTGVNQFFTGYIDRANIAAPGNPAANNLRQWTQSIQGFSLPVVKDSGGFSYKPYRDVIQVCQNGNGTTITKGQCVSIKSGASGLPVVSLARANSLNTMPVVGVVMESINDGAFGRILISGILENVNTNSFNLADKLYLSESSPGDLKSTEPAHPNYSQHIATVLLKSATVGVIEVIPKTPLGHLLGTDSDDFKIGSGTSGTLQQTLVAAGGRETVLRTTPTAIRTLVYPDGSGTFALLSLAQTWSAIQTFSQQIVSSVSTGTAPLSIASTTLVNNLNADMVDGKSVGTSGNTIPLLDGNNTHSGSNTFDGTTDFNGVVTGESANFHSPSSFASIVDDFTGNGTNSGEYSWSTQTSGAGAAVANQAGATNHPGIRRASTGTTAAGYAGWNTRLSYIAPSGGDYFQTILKISANTGCILRIGLQDTFTGADNTDGYYFEFDPSVSANWQMCTATGGTRTKTASSTAVAAATWYNLEIKVNSANTSVEFFINGVSAGTVTTNIPGAAQTIGMSIIFQNDGVSTTSADCDIDLMYWYNKNLTR